MRHESRRGFRLVRVAASGSCLSVLTGLVGTGPSRAGGRARARTRTGALGRKPVKTSRQGAFVLLRGIVSVLTGHEAVGPRGWRR